MKTSTTTRGLCVAAAILILGAANVGLAQTAPAASVLSLGDLESRMVAQGITIREIELRDLVAEVEGRDASGRKVELLVDRRSGEILSRKLDK
ncbi:MAG TPA: PepSY domain-containing protein [Povalibacter sp.]|jgi:hypothetical protein|nr:PepSY domain-containing protein [Povalibacter sp.]